MTRRVCALAVLVLLGGHGTSAFKAPFTLQQGRSGVSSTRLEMVREDEQRRRVLLAGLAVSAGWVAPAVAAGQVQLEFPAQRVLAEKAGDGSLAETEINGKRLGKDALCKGARGNDCNVWVPPEIPDSPEELVGARGEVTSKVFLDLRILKDYNKEVLEDGAVRGRVVIGLYGKEAPKTVAHFLQFFPKAGDRPSYSTGAFFRHEPGKWLEGGRISGLFPTQLAGSESFEWNGGVYPLKAPVEANELHHDRKNLLSHKKFNAGPEFAVLLSPGTHAGIMRASHVSVLRLREQSVCVGRQASCTELVLHAHVWMCTVGMWLAHGWLSSSDRGGAAGELDATNTVFGEVLEGENLLLEMAELPFVTGKSLDPSGSVASNLFAAQNQYFRGLAKAVGDTRVAKTYPGKLLRRVEITKAGVLAAEAGLGEDDDEAEEAEETERAPDTGLKGSVQQQLFMQKRQRQLQVKEDEEARRLLER